MSYKSVARAGNPLNTMDQVGGYENQNNSSKHMLHGLIAGLGSAGLLSVMNKSNALLWGGLIGFGVYEGMTLMDTGKQNRIQNQIDRNAGLVNSQPSNNGNIVNTNDGDYAMMGPFSGNYMLF